MTTPSAQTMLELADKSVIINADLRRALYDVLGLVNGLSASDRARIAPMIEASLEKSADMPTGFHINAVLRASQPAAQAPEPVAWRWRPRGATNWIYNPEASWLAAHHNEHTIEYEPLFTQTPAGTGGDELAYQTFKFIEWRNVRKDRDDFVRAKWQELPDEDRTGPCNIDCNCDHTFYGKNYYRRFSTALSPPPAPDAVRGAPPSHGDTEAS